MKKILILVVVGFFGSCLVACGDNSGSNDLSGKYYLYHEEENIVITDNILTIDGKTALYQDSFWLKNGESDEGELYSINTENKTITIPDEKEYAYTYKDDILTFGYYNDNYLKEGTEQYDKATKMTEEEYEEE